MAEGFRHPPNNRKAMFLPQVDGGHVDATMALN
jgi:hypothetical protein